MAVVVPLSDRAELTAEEEISLRHLNHFLGRHDKYMVAPEGLAVAHEGFGVKRFSPSYFGSVRAHTRLMLAPAFYETFADYEYILTYHLDALVFSDQLLEWCQAGLDFIGAPRLGQSGRLSVVGNGGFALRRVESFLKVLTSNEFAVDPDEYWRAFCAGKPRYLKFLNLPRKYLKRLPRFNNVRRAIDSSLKVPDSYNPCEDIFITENAARFCPGFRIASVEQALRFAFDELPRVAFELNNHQLPFGCHAWFKQDREFWEPYLLK